jgi:cytoskeletal protein CcmA (bactofilin family)
LRVRGRVRGDGDLRIEAAIEGDVVVGGALALDAGSVVEGGVDADEVTVAGEVSGDVNARGNVAITATGSVQGNIKASGLSLEEGGRFIGEIEADFDLPEVIA